MLPVALAAHHPRGGRPAGRRPGRARLAAGRRRASWSSTSTDAERPAIPDGWAGYPAGVVAGLRERLAGGVSVLVDTDVPVGAGLSSSAALDLLGGARAARPRRARAAPAATWWSWPARAENDFVGAPTGILDQSASVLCTAGHALFLDTRDLVSEQVPLDLAAAGLALLVVDSGRRARPRRGRLRRPAAGVRGGGRAARRRPAARGRRRRRPGRAGRRHPEGSCCCAGPGTSSPRTRGCWRWSPRLRGDADPRTIGPVLTAGHASLRDDFEISDPAARRLRRGGRRGRRARRPHGRRRLRRQRHRARRGRPRSTPSPRRSPTRFAREGLPAPRTFVTVPSAGARRLA